MSSSDAAKRVRARVVDRLCPTGLVFHHVPKCGGTSVGRAIRRAYGVSQATILPRPSFDAIRTVRPGAGWDEPELVRLREAMLAYLLHADVRGVAAHVPFSTVVHDAFRDSYRFVTVLRDPVERFVSQYLWAHDRPGGHGHITRDLDAFLPSPTAITLGTSYARYLCGRPLEQAELPGLGVELAVANLDKLDAVGFSDDLAGFEVDLRRLTGKRIRVGWENVGRQRGASVHILAGEHRARIEELCAPDLAVWAAAQRFRPDAR